MKPVFSAIAAEGVDTRALGLAPAHFQPNNFRDWTVGTGHQKVDPNRVRINYGPGHPSMQGIPSHTPILFDPEFYEAIGDKRPMDDLRWQPDNVVEYAVDQYRLFTDIIAEMWPGRSIIPYGYPLGLWPARLDDPDSLSQWRRANGRLKYGREEGRIDGTKGYSDKLAATGPVCYWFGDDWAAITKAMVAEARRLEPDKPCYPWIWFRRHNSVGPAATRYQMIPVAEWRDMLGLVLEIADGAVLFSDGRWDAEAAERARVAAAAGRAA